MVGIPNEFILFVWIKSCCPGVVLIPSNTLCPIHTFFLQAHFTLWHYIRLVWSLIFDIHIHSFSLFIIKMPSFMSIAAVLALSSTILASPQYGYDNLYNKRHVTGFNPSGTAPIHTGTGTGKIPYPTAGAKFMNHTSPGPKHPIKKGKSSSTSYESTTTIYIEEEDPDCTSSTSYAETTTLYSTYIEEADPTDVYDDPAVTYTTTSTPSAKALPIKHKHTSTTSATTTDTDDYDYPTSTSATTLSTSTKSFHGKGKFTKTSSSSSSYYYSTTASTPAGPVKPSKYPTMKWKGSGAWNGTMTSSSSAYPDATGY